METKKIIFHCGSAKTGSTTLQAHLMASPGQLKAVGAFYCHRMVRSGDVDPLNHAVRDLRSGRKRDAAIRLGRERLQYLFFEEGYDTVILSNESALGDPLHDNRPGFFPLLKPALVGLTELFSGYRVVPIFFIRNQATLLPSFYGQRVRQGASYNLQDFVEWAGAFDLSWLPVIKALRDVFPGEVVEVHQFEKFVKNPSVYTANLLGRLLGVPALSNYDEQLKNVAARSHALNLMRTTNRGVESLVFLSREKQVKLKKKLRWILFPLLEQLKTGESVQALVSPKHDLQMLYRADLDAFEKKLVRDVQLQAASCEN